MRMMNLMMKRMMTKNGINPVVIGIFSIDVLGQLNMFLKLNNTDSMHFL